MIISIGWYDNKHSLQCSVSHPAWTFVLVCATKQFFVRLFDGVYIVKFFFFRSLLKNCPDGSFLVNSPEVRGLLTRKKLSRGTRAVFSWIGEKKKNFKIKSTFFKWRFKGYCMYVAISCTGKNINCEKPLYSQTLKNAPTDDTRMSNNL